MLSVEGLTKRFGNTTAVDGVSFAVDSPQMVGVIGRSGAGKSTMLRMINRLTPASEGHVWFEGTDVLALKGRARRRWQSDCAMIFQQFNLVARLDVMTNILLGRLFDMPRLAGMLGWFSRQDREEALAVMERLDIAHLATQRAETLSGGQQQRVAIARALMQRPRVLLADEPIASLDPRNAQIVIEALTRIQQEDGLMVLVNLHTLDTARSCCHRIIALREGRMVFDGLPSELTDEKAQEIYGTEGLEEALSGVVTSVALPKAPSPRTVNAAA